MPEDLQATVGPRVRELDALMKEANNQWRNETRTAEQKFLRAAELRSQLAQTAESLLEQSDLDLQKVDRILAETLNNFSVMNLESNRPDRALELATKALDLLLNLEQFDQAYFDTMDLLKEIHTQLNQDDQDLIPTPTIRTPVRKVPIVFESFAPDAADPIAIIDPFDLVKAPPVAAILDGLESFAPPTDDDADAVIMQADGPMKTEPVAITAQNTPPAAQTAAPKKATTRKKAAEKSTDSGEPIAPKKTTRKKTTDNPADAKKPAAPKKRSTSKKAK